MNNDSCLNSQYYIKKKPLAVAWSFIDLNLSGAVSTSGISHYPLKKTEIFSQEFKNYGRLDGVSKAVCNSIASLLKELNLYPSDSKLNIPIFFCSENASCFSDIKYFSDYLDFNETAGRANKFLYTLPTSPLGEASVHFKLTGTILYVTDSNNSFLKAFQLLDNYFYFNSKNSEYAIIGFAESYNSLKADAVFFIMKNSDDNLDCIEMDLNKINSFSQIKKQIMENFVKI